jgi:hypothetical protein
MSLTRTHAVSGHANSVGRRSRFSGPPCIQIVPRKIPDSPPSHAYNLDQWTVVRDSRQIPQLVRCIACEPRSVLAQYYHFIREKKTTEGVALAREGEDCSQFTNQQSAEQAAGANGQGFFFAPTRQQPFL